MLGGYTFYDYPRFAEFKFNNIPLIYDKETNYVKINDIIPAPKNLNLNYINSPLKYTNYIIQNWIKNNKKYINSFKNNHEFCNIVNSINTLDEEIWDEFNKHKTTSYYYLNNVHDYNGDKEMFKGYYFNIKLLPKIIFDLRN